MGSMGHKTCDPTPAEIQKRCKELQDRWTEGEWRKRIGADEPTWTPPACSVDEDVVELRQEQP